MIFLILMNTVDTRFFRAGVGTVIYNQAGQVAFFKRAKHPVGVWQLQQGGIDIGEDVETTLWRELEEEIGLLKSDIDSIHEMPYWTVYQDKNSVTDPNKSRLGQAHRWFFLRLSDSTEIDLSKAKDNENSDYKWVSFSDAISVTDELKKHVYKELETYFLKHIFSSN